MIGDEYGSGVMMLPCPEFAMGVVHCTRWLSESTILLGSSATSKSNVSSNDNGGESIFSSLPPTIGIKDMLLWAAECLLLFMVKRVWL